VDSVRDWDQRAEDERSERRGLEQRAATLIAALLFTIGLVATGARGLAASGSTARFILTIAMVILGLAVVVLAVALTRKTSDNNRWWQLPAGRRQESDLASATDESVRNIITGNVTVLLTTRIATFLLAVGVVLAITALLISVYDPADPLGSSARPLEVHTTR
jgi:hypothetical protein